MNLALSPRLKAALLAAVFLLIGMVLGRVTAPVTPTVISQTPQGNRQAEMSTLDTKPSDGATVEQHGAVDDPIDELWSAMDESDLVSGTLRFSTALQDLNATDAADAAKVLWARPGRSVEINERKRLLGYRWGQVGGAKAVKFALAQNGQGKIAVITSAVAGWASVDPAAAMEWMEANPTPGFNGIFQGGLIDGWARHDLAGVTDYVLGLSKGMASEQMVRTVASEQLRQDPAGALPWALGLPDSPAKAAAIDEVAARWAWSDAPAAIEQVAMIPDPDQMRATMKTAMAIWTRSAPEAASTYLAKMPDGDIKDHAVAAFSQTAATENPEACAAWAETISDATLREQSLIVVGRGWMRQDSESALNWLRKSGLSQDAQSRIHSR